MIDPSFFNAFSAWFGLDVIDLSNNEQLDKNAGLLVSSLLSRDVNLAALQKNLARFLVEWDADTVQRFIESSDVDWLFDVESERTLRLIVTLIIEYIEKWQ